MSPHWAYFLLTFTACFATLQLGLDRGGFRKALFFRNKRLNRILALLLLVSCLGALFAWNYMFRTDVVQGLGQAWVFSASVASAIAFTFIVTSVLNRKHTSQEHAAASGLDALKDAAVSGLDALKSSTFFQALRKARR